MSSEAASESGHVLVGHIASLHCYPIKSCTAISSDAASITQLGLKISDITDRHFMVVKENGDFITQRQKARMASIRTAVEEGELVLQSDFMKTSCRVPLKPAAEKEKIKSCRVWKDRLDSLDCGEAVSTWLSECVGEPGLRLVATLPEMKKRPISHSNTLPQDELAYHDDGPLLVTNTASLKDLKSKIPGSEEITMTNFRPNIVIETISKEPWEEDRWTSLFIGDSKNVQLKVLFPCGRCLFTTIDPKKCERRSDGEPLKTLKTFRVFPEIDKTSPMFGVYGGVRSEGIVKVGDPVFAIKAV
ncbi:mitochondrial amidoxime-reducing component 1 [Aplysia californica]|uniref:Mitochondrial amidoxime-reducing component 1 n=1 Tax=Aplysia californica TaxID=6500 RepID=A0ABM0ZWN3_APLCA|nr:mitochondrial amidoxime-reducing component 1 [Aplysia californica]